MAGSHTLALVLLLTTLAAHAQNTYVTGYTARIETRSDGGAHVSAAMAFSPNGAQPVSLVIRHINNADVTHLKMQDASGQPLVTQARTLVSGTSFTMSGGSGPWTVDYDVVPTSGVVTAIPLPVPSLSLRPGGTASIELKLPAGEALYGDLFPRMALDSKGDAHATVLGVPSLALVHHKPAQQISRGEALLTSSNLANLAMLPLLFLGLYTLSRKLMPGTVASER